MLVGTGTRPDRAPPLSAGNGIMDETALLDASIARSIIILQENGSTSVKSASVLAKKEKGVLDAVIANNTALLLCNTSFRIPETATQPSYMIPNSRLLYYYDN
jgi:hypothetical protein